MKVSWRIRRRGGNWEGVVFLPVGLKGAAAVTAKGKTKAEALSRAGQLADKVLNDPVIQAALPPQAQALIKGVKLLASAKAAGKVKELAKKLNPGGRLKKLAKAFF